MLKQAVFLAGGRGTRLGALTDHTPKPLLAVNGEPFLTTLIRKAARLGLEDVILLAGYLGERIRDHYAAHPVTGVRIRVLIEPEALGTGGALWAAREILDPCFLLANGDTLFDFNWLDLAPLSTADTLGVLALRRVPAAERYSAVALEGDRITGFNTPGTGEEQLINGGVYILDRAIVPPRPERPVSLENDIFPGLAATGKLAGMVSDGYFIDIGVPEDYARAQTEIPARSHNKAVFFDRDGTLNIDHGYVGNWNDFTWIDGAREAIKLCNDRGYLVFVVTNQAGVARGYYDEQAVYTLHQHMNEDLAAIGAHINRFEYCPHHPDVSHPEYGRACSRRKPGPDMILSCLSTWQLSPGDCLLIGDKQIDAQAARAAGIKGYIFKSGNLHDFLLRLLSNNSPEATDLQN